jgi:NitT/TauT family transport system substrate-binding protein
MKIRSSVLCYVLAAAALGACGGEKPAPAAEPAAMPAPEAAAPRKLTVQLNWKPEPEFGPFFAAQVSGAFVTQRLDVDLRAGGSGAPTIELLGAKNVPFAIVSANEIIRARAVGNNVVGIFAVYQKNPMALITHRARGLKTLADVVKAEGTLALERGAPYAGWIEKTIGFGPAKIVPSPYGDLSFLRNDPKYAMQGFATSEPIAAKKAGLDVDVFVIADAGFNPYETVLAVHEDLLKTDAELVKRMLAAVSDGFTAYLKDPARTNAAMAKLNPTMDAETFAAVAEAQRPLMENDATRANGPGSMDLARWTTLVTQMKDTGLINAPVEPASCFRDPGALLKQ